ncbi:MAG: sarcosine oxidase subunit gamma family protein [Pseudomonadota bacterium]
MAKMFSAHPLEQFAEKLKTPAGKGVIVEYLPSNGMVHLFAARGKTAAVERALGIKGSPGRSSVTKEFSALPLSPGQWLLICERPDLSGSFADWVKGKLKGNGYVSEQSDSRVRLRLSGPRVTELMQKGCRLDLDPDATGAGWCAQTQMAQCSVVLHQVNDNPVYDILVYSGFVRNFAEWLEHTGAQLGIRFKI